MNSFISIFIKQSVKEPYFRHKNQGVWGVQLLCSASVCAGRASLHPSKENSMHLQDRQSAKGWLFRRESVWLSFKAFKPIEQTKNIFINQLVSFSILCYIYNKECAITNEFSFQLLTKIRRCFYGDVFIKRTLWKNIRGNYRRANRVDWYCNRI